MAKQAGLQSLTVQESVNARLGQGGFDLYYNGATPDNVEGNWVALASFGNSNTGSVDVHAETSIGSNLTDDGSTGELKMIDGNTVYGPFTKLVSATIGSGCALIAYRG